MKNERIKTVGICFVLLLSVGCANRSRTIIEKKSAPTPQVERTPFRVTVKSGGKDVTNASSSLVRRVTLSRADVEALEDRSGKLPVSIKRDRDLHGGFVGLKIVDGKDAVLQQLSLERSDLVTAIGTTSGNRLEELELLVERLRSNDSETLTLLRRGQPHKVLYFISTDNDGTASRSSVKKNR